LEDLNVSVSNSIQSSSLNQEAAKRAKREGMSEQAYRIKPTFSAFIVAEVTISFKSLLRDRTVKAEAN